MAVVRMYHEEVVSGGLPPVCMKCGADADDKVETTLAITKSIFLGIVVLQRTRSITLIAPMCRKHRNHWVGRKTIIVLLVFACFLVPFLGIYALTLREISSNIRGLCCFGSFLLTLLMLIIAVLLDKTSIRAIEITDVDVTVRNVSLRFAEAKDGYI